MATQTSIMSFMQLKDEKVLGERQRTVYKFIGFNPDCSDREISQGTGLTINCTTARRNELVKYGLVMNSAVKYDAETNRYVSAWKVR
jgi:predicted transcriptional regulator